MARRFAILMLGALALGAVPLFAAPATAGSGQQRPERIVSLSPTATEMLFAIGAGKQVVAVDDQSDYPSHAPTTDLSGFEPNIEAIAGYDPDLVVLSGNDAKSQLENLGIETLVLQAANRLDDAYAQIRKLGKVTRRTAAANNLVGEMQTDIADVVAEIPGDGERPTAYYELDETYFSADSSTFIGRLLKLAGFRNLADQAKGGSGYPQLSAEAVVDANPDVIFLADTECCGQNRATVAARPGFADVTAVKDGHVVELDDDVASRWGPRVVDLLRTLVKERNSL
jgi:iron complex transport system substrate-binding protein